MPVPRATSTGLDSWGRAHRVALVAVILAGVVIRIVLLPTEGLRDDLDQFALWLRHIATEGLASLYGGTAGGPVTFGPVMAYLWTFLTLIQPAFATVTDASDPAIGALMKLPASVADLGLGTLVAFALRDRPRWAVIGAAAVVLHPAVFYVSAWWGQYESIFLLSGLGAALFAINGRNGWAAALVAVSLMTKPQAIPFLIPFSAWFWAQGYARGGDRAAVMEVARAGLIGLGVVTVLWLPFLAEGGPGNYLANIEIYQDEIFNVLSLRAWNAWWLLQETAAGGLFIADDVPVAGPFALRHMGYMLTAFLSVLIGWVIIRDPRPRTLLLGLVTSVLVVFSFMTQMHERYAYAALVFLVLLLPERDIRWLFAVFSVVFTLNLVAAIPWTPAIGAELPINGPFGFVGSVAMIAVTGWAYVLMHVREPEAVGVSPGGP